MEPRSSRVSVPPGALVPVLEFTSASRGSRIPGGVRRTGAGLDRALEAFRKWGRRWEARRVGETVRKFTTAGALHGSEVLG